MINLECIIHFLNLKNPICAHTNRIKTCMLWASSEACCRLSPVPYTNTLEQHTQHSRGYPPGQKLYRPTDWQMGQPADISAQLCFMFPGCLKQAGTPSDGHRKVLWRGGRVSSSRRPQRGARTDRRGSCVLPSSYRIMCVSQGVSGSVSIKQRSLKIIVYFCSVRMGKNVFHDKSHNIHQSGDFNVNIKKVFLFLSSQKVTVII